MNPDVVEFYGAEAWLATSRLSQIAARNFKMVAHSNGLEPFMSEVLQDAGLHNTARGERPKWYQQRLHYPSHHAFTKVDAIVTVSAPEAEFAIRNHLQPAERVLAIDNALSSELLDQEITAVRPNTIGYCGSWLSRKGTALLVADLTEVLREYSDWRLHLVGVGEHFQASSVFHDDVVPRIVVTPFVGCKQELRRIYHSWAIAIMPSVYESFGLVAAESMACGCALVANRTGFAAGLEDSCEALLLDEAKSPMLFRCIVRLIKDPKLRALIAENGWKRVQSLRWERSILQLESFYQELIDSPPRVFS